MKQYLNVAQIIINEGMVQENRTGVDTLSVFGREMRFDLLDGFPAPTTKRGFFKGAKVELSWMLKGLTNTSYLKEHGVNFWDKWAIEGEREVLKSLDSLKMDASLQGKTVDEELYAAGDVEALTEALGLSLIHI